jgi:NADH-quinone oxidoreductase subunit F
LHGKPTTVNNVETLAHVPWILRHGAQAYRQIGTAESHGTLLCTLDGAVENPGVYEVPFGTTYRQLIWDHGGGPKGGKTIRALLPALSCAFLGPDQLDTPIAHESLKAVGTTPGCGGVHLILEGDDVVQRIVDIADFFMKEQCGQCPPCRMETNQFAHILKAVQSGKGGDFQGQLQKIAGFTRGKGQCSLIEMAAAPILSAVQRFRDDFEACVREQQQD